MSEISSGGLELVLLGTLERLHLPADCKLMLISQADREIARVTVPFSQDGPVPVGCDIPLPVYLASGEDVGVHVHGSPLALLRGAGPPRPVVCASG